MSRILVATLLGPGEKQWDYVRRKASVWADAFVVEYDETGGAWGNEAPYRKRLWDMAMAAAKDEDWVFILDSDFVLAGDPRVLTQAGSADAWAFDLYDLWECNPWRYRDDGYWRAHDYPRAWIFRAAAFRGVDWQPERGIHTGHAPVVCGTVATAPHRFAILHLGWLPSVREHKKSRYHAVWDKLTPAEQAHVRSIRDLKPNLVELPAELAEVLADFPA